MRIPYETLFDTLRRVLLRTDLAPDRAELCARLFADASRDGVASHGLNRFPRFIETIHSGLVDVRAHPMLVEAHGSLERWDGRRGPGNLNAYDSMTRAIAIALERGIGCVALGNTNHWMRGGSYGWQAAEAAMIGICWTNTMPNLPPWGSAEPRLGNNPLVIAVPHGDQPIVLDIAMSQFSFGALTGYGVRGAPLPVFGGYDANGELTRDAGAVIASSRLLPIGYWKDQGSRLRSTSSPRRSPVVAPRIKYPPEALQETGLSQVFLAADAVARRLHDAPGVWSRRRSGTCTPRRHSLERA